jgi:hypothetical protein
MINGVPFLPAAGFAILFFNLDRVQQVMDRRKARGNAKKHLQETQRQTSDANRRHWRRVDPQQTELSLEPPVKIDNSRSQKAEQKP